MLEREVELNAVNLSEGLSVEQLDKVIGRRDYRLFLNSRNALYRERGMKQNPPPRDEALRLMADNPNLIKRPIVKKGNRLVLGFDEPALEKLIGN